MSPLTIIEHFNIFENTLYSLCQCFIVEAFKKVFGGEVTRERIAMAIAAFERTLVSVNSPLDKYPKGRSGQIPDYKKEKRLEGIQDTDITGALSFTAG